MIAFLLRPTCSPRALLAAGALAAGALAATATAQSFAAPPPTIVALSGTAAPAGGTFSSFTNAVLNSNGQVAFNAVLTGGTSTSGIFTGTPGSLQALALQGTAAPAGGTYGTLSSAANLNSSGTLAFQAPLTGGSSNSGVFYGTPGSLQAVALQGTAAPSGGNYNAFAATGINASSAPLLNASGQVAFQSTLTGGTSTSGVFVGAPGALQTAAQVGGTAPGGGTYTTTVTPPLLNNNGQVSFVSIIGASGPQGIFAGAPGAIQQVMLQGTTAPGAGGQLYGTPGTTYTYNNAGQVGFIASLTGSGASTTGVFAGAPGAVQALALNNTVAPGGTGGTFTSFSNVTVNSAGRFAFSSNLTGGSAASGLFVGTPGMLQAVALAGGADPDGSGATFASFSSSLLQNGVGQIAFTANLTGTGVITGTNSVALFAGLPGNLVQIVRTGDVIDVDPGPGTDLRTVYGSISLLINAGGQDGKGIDFNDSGLIAYRLAFTDGSTGVFTSVVPEPSTWALTVAGAALTGLIALRHRRRALRKPSTTGRA